MDIVVVVAVSVLLLGILIALNVWQVRLEEAEVARTEAEVADAVDRGSNTPLAQHPIIDVHACIGCGACVDACPEEGVLGLVHGVAKVIHGSRCLGHGLCAVACPVQAITIGLGELAKRPDLPQLSERFESSVPGVYVVGELGGLSLIRVAVDQGVRAIDAIAKELRGGAAGGANRAVAGGGAPAPAAAAAPVSPVDGGGPVADVLIVGAGPAGFAAALRAIERRLSYVLIDQERDFGGTVRKYPRRKLTLTGPLSLPLHGPVGRREFLKEELIELWEGIAAKHGVSLRGETRLVGLERQDGVLCAETSTGPIVARRALLALGRRGTPRRLGVPGEDAERVLYQLIDAATYSNERILVVGGGDSAAEAALALAAQSGNQVALSYRRPRFFRLKRRNEDRLQAAIAEGRIRALLGTHVRAIEPGSVTLAVGEDPDASTLSLPNDYVFVLAGGDPPFPLLQKIGIRLGGGDAAAATEPEPVTAGST